MILTYHGRDRRIFLATGSSILAKGGGVLLQLIAIPLVIRALGAERYAVFSLISSVLVFISFAQFGMGSYLTQQIARKLPLHDYEGIRQLAWTAVILVSAISVLFGIILFISSQIWGLFWLWGEAYVLHSDVLRWGFYYLLNIGIISLVVNTLSGCQAGYQELHVSNLYGGLGNLLAAVGLILIVYFEHAGERWFWSVLYAVPLLVAWLNVGHMLFRHKELRYRVSAFRSNLIFQLLSAGGGFMVVQSVLPLLQREGAKMALARSGNMEGVAHLSVFLQISTIAGGLIAMFVVPLYAALADAFGRGDVNWISCRLRQIRCVFLLIVVAVSLVAYFGGERLLSVWLGSGIVISRAECMMYVLYFFTATFVYINQMFLMAQGSVRMAVAGSFFEIVLLLCLFIFSCPTNAGDLFVAMALIQLVSSLPISTLALKRIKLG